MQWYTEIQFSFRAGLFGVYVYLIPFMETDCGATKWEAAQLQSLLTIFQIVGNLRQRDASYCTMYYCQRNSAFRYFYIGLSSFHQTPRASVHSPMP